MIFSKHKIYSQIESSDYTKSKNNSALILDRDGVINIDHGYVGTIKDFFWNKEVFNLTKQYFDRGFLIFIATNQSGIARGYYTEKDFLALTDWMVQEFIKRGIKITSVFWCPHHQEITGRCDCRKPNPKMLLDIEAIFNINLKTSYFIGDNDTDMEAGITAGIGNLFQLSMDSKNITNSRWSVINSLKDIHLQ